VRLYLPQTNKIIQEFIDHLKIWTKSDGKYHDFSDELSRLFLECKYNITLSVKAIFDIPVMEKKLLLSRETNRWSMGNQWLIKALDDIQNCILSPYNFFDGYSCILDIFFNIRKLRSHNFLHDVSILITWQQVSVADSFTGYVGNNQT
jgi:hypothetical protein